MILGSTIGSDKDKLFGGLEVKLSIYDQIAAMIISGLTKPKCKKLREFLEYRC
jgi:hypothetical protein